MTSFFYISLSVFICAHSYLYFCLYRAFGKGRWMLPTALFFAGILAFWYFRHIDPVHPAARLAMLCAFVWLGMCIITSCCCLAADTLLFTARLWTKCQFRRAKKSVSPPGGTRTGAPPPDNTPTDAPLREEILTDDPQRKEIPAGAPQQKEDPAKAHPRFAARRFLRAAMLLGLCISAYSVYEAHNIEPVHLRLATGKLPKNITRIRIAAVSDVHLGRFIGPEALRKIAKITQEAKPDIFISLGDLVDGDMRAREEDAAILRSIRAPLGKFAVMGNHEFSQGEKNSEDFHSRAGLTLLRGSWAKAGPLLIAGVDDISARRYGPPAANALPLLRSLRESAPRAFILFLAHRPDASRKSAAFFDLQLSGHTHGGQIWPASVLQRVLAGYRRHLSAIRSKEGASSLLFTSHGSGYWGPPMRLFTPPEVLILDLVPKDTP